MSEWRDIGSAEHDEETYILVFTETGFCEVCRVGWFEDGEPVWFNGDCRVYPTHWMPLPAPPAEP